MSAVAAFYAGSGGLVAALEEALDTAGVDRSALRAVDLGPVDDEHWNRLDGRLII